MVIGTCQFCSGPVSTHNFLGNRLDKPRCGKCGAVAKSPYGEVIPMEREPVNMEQFDQLVRWSNMGGRCDGSCKNGSCGNSECGYKVTC